MQEKRSLVCTVCPTGCNLEVCMTENGVGSLAGNKCKRGADYAIAECTDPKRTLTSVIRVIGGQQVVVPVKTDKPVPKNLLFECMQRVNQCQLHAPVNIGDVVIENILDTGANIVATRNIQ